jgi:hypothetical protein
VQAAIAPGLYDVLNVCLPDQHCNQADLALQVHVLGRCFLRPRRPSATSRDTLMVEDLGGDAGSEQAAR